jgi:hypothetical protein
MNYINDLNYEPVYSIDGSLLDMRRPFVGNEYYTDMPLIGNEYYTDMPLIGNEYYTDMPTMDEILLTNFPNYYENNYIGLSHLGESIFNKWQYLDNYSRLRVNNYFLNNYPSNWIFDINSYNNSESFIRFLLSDYSYSLRNKDSLSEDDIIFLILLDKSLSTKLKKEVKDLCEKTKIEKITKTIWDKFSTEIKKNTDITNNMIKSYKAIYSQYDKDIDYIKLIYKLLQKCYKTRKAAKKNFDIEVLLRLFNGCDKDSFKKAIDDYEIKKKYLLNNKY